jgi:hypothetical protein
MLVTKFKTKKILKDTLRDMRQGETITIRVRDFKANAIRNAACLLKNEGYLFTVSDNGRIDDTLITRIS